MISTDLAELLGSAMGLVMLFPKLPLWAGVSITTCDVFVILLVGDPLRRRPVRLFELLIAAMVCLIQVYFVLISDHSYSYAKVFTIFVCVLIIVLKVDVDWGEAFLGYVPSKKIFQAGSLYTGEASIVGSENNKTERSLFLAIGIIGATVMPHGLFVGSALATQDRVSMTPLKEDISNPDLELSPEEHRPTGILNSIKSHLRIKGVAGSKNRPQRHEDWGNNSCQFVESHVHNGIVDLVLSLLGVAVVINSM